jgi:hypothetical protein
MEALQLPRRKVGEPTKLELLEIQETFRRTDVALEEIRMALRQFAQGVATAPALAIGAGGTGETTAIDAFDALDPLTTKGDILTHDGIHSVRKPAGADGLVLTASSVNADGLAWASPVLFFAKDTDQISTSTTLADASGMAFAVAANKIYAFEFFIVYTCANTSTFPSFSVNGPASPVAVNWLSEIMTTRVQGTDNLDCIHLFTFDVKHTTTVVQDTGGQIARLKGGFTNGANAGTFTLRFATSNAGNAVTVLSKRTWGWMKEVS